MQVRVEILQLESVVENLEILANAYRDAGKYLSAGVLYRRAKAILESVRLREQTQLLLAQIL